MTHQRHELLIRMGSIDEIIDLRHRILRAGMPRSAASFAGDDEATTAHAVAESDGKIVGCATIVRRDWNEQPAWQLRGMAVEPTWQRQGVGARLVAELERLIRASDFSRRFWCNARSPAVGFYERCGWSIASEEFVIETAGPHWKMTRSIE